MRQIFLPTVTAAIMGVGISTATLAAPFQYQGPDQRATNVERVDYYYWHHHRYHHRDWDRDHHNWHYYD
jgi:hypothetical protein